MGEVYTLYACHILLLFFRCPLIVTVGDNLPIWPAVAVLTNIAGRVTAESALLGHAFYSQQLLKDGRNLGVEIWGDDIHCSSFNKQTEKQTNSNNKKKQLLCCEELWWEDLIKGVLHRTVYRNNGTWSIHLFLPWQLREKVV